MTHAAIKTGEPVKIRIASSHDYEDIRQVYVPYVQTTAITFETQTPSANEYHARIQQIQTMYPCLVATHNDAVVGFAYAHQLNERAAYIWSAELSIYFATEFISRGAGRRITEGMLSLLELQGMRNVFSLITLPNAPSERLHITLGFEHLGTQRKAGYKCGNWHDVGWFQKSLGAYDREPESITPFPQLPTEGIAAIIKRINSPYSDHILPLDARTVSSD